MLILGRVVTLQPKSNVRNKEEVAENKVCRNSPVTRLGSDSPTSSKNEINCDDVVDGNHYENVNCDARNGVEDAN